jgi:hypothetical protein
MEQNKDFLTLLGEAVINLGTKLYQLVLQLKKKVYTLRASLALSRPKAAPENRQTNVNQKFTSYPLAQKTTSRSSTTLQNLKNELEKRTKVIGTGNLGTPKPGSDLLNYDKRSTTRSDSSSSGTIASSTPNPYLAIASEIVKQDGWVNLKTFKNHHNEIFITLSKPSKTVIGATEAVTYTQDNFMTYLRNKAKQQGML